jgi:hypothetical protein
VDNLLDNWSHEDLEQAYAALADTKKQEELYHLGSALLVFFVDTNLQEQLMLYIDEYKAKRRQGGTKL